MAQERSKTPPSIIKPVLHYSCDDSSLSLISSASIMQFVRYNRCYVSQSCLPHDRSLDSDILHDDLKLVALQVV